MATKQRTKGKIFKKVRITNWAEYNRSLVQRGHLPIPISTDVLGSWKPIANQRTRGGQHGYSDIAIELALPLRLLFKMGIRQTEGILYSRVSLADLHVDVPHYQTLCRGAAAVRFGSLPIRTMQKFPFFFCKKTQGWFVRFGRRH